MAERLILPLDDESDDTVMRLKAPEARALHLLLASLPVNEMVAKGLTLEQALLIANNVTHVCY